MSHRTDYAKVAVPANKPPDEYSREERRADLLDRVLDAGHPSRISQTRLSGEYGVNQSTVSRDLDALAKSIEAHVGNRQALTVEAVYEKSIRGMLDSEDYRGAAKFVGEWDSWVTERTDLRRLREKVGELEGRLEAATERSSAGRASGGGDDAPLVDVPVYELTEPEEPDPKPGSASDAASALTDPPEG